jgi:hypothetical protein
LLDIKHLEDGRAKAAAVLAASTNEDGTINPFRAAGVVTSGLPPPWGIVLPILIGMVPGALQEIRVQAAKRDAKSIINGVDTLRIEEPEVRAAFKKHKDKIRGQMTKRARRLVAEETLT